VLTKIYLAQISKLTALEHLGMAANFLLQLPAAEALPISMTSLDLTDNRLTTLPADIGRLSALRSLLCGRNLLAVLPPAVNA
jgi:leucine-rich repeat protein SHOC2